MSSPASEEEVDAILKKALAGETVTKPETLKFKMAFLQVSRGTVP